MQGARILIVEDDPAIATVIRVAVTADGAEATLVDGLARRDKMLAERQFDALVTDVMLPDGNGLDGLAERVAAGELPPVIVLSAQNTLDTAVRATEGGAFDYLPKPFDLDELLASIRAAVRRQAGGTAAPPSHEAAPSDLPIIGRDAAMQEVYRTIARVSPTDLSVLVLGESGTGKELVAQSIHRSSRRRSGPFVAVNMAAIPRELIESELFGHEKGAFTGALARATGRFEQARGGTLFLDEIGDMPFEAQTRLLRVLQDGDYTPVGAARSVRADVRIVAATNQNLAELVGAGRFREDLYYRLNVIPLSLPPLRDRRSDVPLLARHFLQRAAAAGLPAKTMATAAAELLSEWHWPGNVRELDNVIQRLMLLTRSDQIEADDVVNVLRLLPEGGPMAPVALPAGNAEVELERAVRRWLQGSVADAAARDQQLFSALIGRVEQLVIDHALERTGGNQLKAASLLGINRNTLRQKRAN
jgi:two-component system, NtrC family, nitrogen regulation response regulator GlnG